MEQFFSSIHFDLIGIVLLSVLLILLIIHSFFYLRYYTKPIRYKRKQIQQEAQQNTPSVSVVIVSKNDSLNLEKNLPSILNQDYPNFEVIVVNEGATDETDFLLKRLKSDHSNLYSTFSPISDNNVRNKILPLTIGIKAARNEVLLFTEANCIISSDKWIRSMVKPIINKKEISLGFNNYISKNKFWKKLAIFDNLLFSIQYLSKAILNRPFIGTYRNIAFKKDLFFNNKGFSSVLNFECGELVFINKIMTKENTAVVLENDSFTATELSYYDQWKDSKIAYYKSKSNYSNFKPCVFSIETCCRFLFDISLIASIIYSVSYYLWLYLSISILLGLLRFISQIICFRKFSRVFDSTRFSISIPYLELIQVLVNSRFVRLAKSSKRKRF